MAIYTADAQMFADDIHILHMHSPHTIHTSLRKTPENVPHRRDALWGNTI